MAEKVPQPPTTRFGKKALEVHTKFSSDSSTSISMWSSQLCEGRIITPLLWSKQAKVVKDFVKLKKMKARRALVSGLLQGWQVSCIPSTTWQWGLWYLAQGSQEWPWTCDPPTSPSPGLGWQVCTNKSGLFTGNWTQVFLCTRQALYKLSYIPVWVLGSLLVILVSEHILLKMMGENYLHAHTHRSHWEINTGWMVG